MRAIPSNRRWGDPTRRDVLRAGFAGLGLFAIGGGWSGCGDGGSLRASNLANVGPLGEPDANGVRVPAGFTARVVARTGEQPVSGSAYAWHRAPDGGATFATEDGGWIYVSNCEFVPGGVGALRFDRDGNVVDAYPILAGQTNINCAGGLTPWGTWLSCEELDRGRVWECDPLGVASARSFDALGVFKHEAVAVDPLSGQLYLTEDEGQGRFYRFTATGLNPDGTPDLRSGVLEAMRVLDPENPGSVEWLPIPDPTWQGATPVRLQVPDSTPFRGGEGIWYADGVVYFSTKGDNRIWTFDIAAQRLAVLYDDDRFPSPVLRGVDNVTVSAQGDVLVAEDGDDMQLVALAPSGEVVPIVQVVGHQRSEITGPAFDPSGRRLYFSSQRGSDGNLVNSLGVTYEVTGPFFI